MARTPVTVHVVRLPSRLPSTDGTRFDHDATRAKPHAPPFSAHPVFGPSRGVGRPVRPATARRDDTGDTQARIRRRRLFASVRARLQRDRRSSPRASRASPRGSFKLTLVTGAFRSRSNASRRDSVAGEKKARARARRSETRAGTSSRKRASSATPRSKRAGLATLTRLAPATWHASRRAERTLTRTNDEASLLRGNARDENIQPPPFTKKIKPFAPPLRLDAEAPPSFSKRISRLRAARVSVPRPTPRGDELWLAQRMREVGGRVSSREHEAAEARGKARASVFGGVVGRAARRATRAESRDGKRSGTAESRKSESSRVSSAQTRTFRSPSVTSSGRVTFTVTPSPFDPKAVRRRFFTQGKKKASANRDDERADSERYVSRVDEVFAADAAAWDVTGSDAGSDGETATERAMLESLRAARARDA